MTLSGIFWQCPVSMAAEACEVAECVCMRISKVQRDLSEQELHNVPTTRPVAG